MKRALAVLLQPLVIRSVAASLNGDRRAERRGPRLQWGVTRRRHNLRLGLALGVVRTVQAEVQPWDRPVFSLDVGLGKVSVWATWSTLP